MLTAECAVSEASLDVVTLRPAEYGVREVLLAPLDAAAINYEGRERFPDEDILRDLATGKEVRLTMPVRIDGFDPLDDDSLYGWLPDRVRQVFVTGYSAYLTDDKARRAIAPRLRVTRERTPDARVGIKSIEQIAPVAGSTRHELLSRSAHRDVRALQVTGFGGKVALYAPTALTDDDDEILDAVGTYVPRHRPVARALPDDAATDALAEGRAHEVLLKASHDYALIGSVDDIRRRIDDLHNAGIDFAAGYPARGVDELAE